MSGTQGTQNGDSLGSARRWQFSLRQVFLGIFAAAVCCALAVQFPRWTTFVVAMLLLLFCPLAVAATIRAALCRIGFIETGWASEPAALQDKPFRRRMWECARFLGFIQPEKPPSLGSSLVVAIVTTATVVVMWPAIRELGLTAAVGLDGRPMFPVPDIVRSLPETFGHFWYWCRLWAWEVWAVARWWLLFSTLTALGIWATIPARRWTDVEPWSATVSRLFLFAPWLVVLEIAFLAGVWLYEHDVVPAPDAGFAITNFHWKQWHWDCWLDRQWLVRGAAPTWIAGYAFFRTVLRFHWMFAVVGAILLIPFALTISIGWTVLYLDVAQWWVGHPF
jgi:hypothetical protein